MASLSNASESQKIEMRHALFETEIDDRERGQIERGMRKHQHHDSARYRGDRSED